MWAFITNLGDTAVTVPLALLTCGFLCAWREVRLALGWGLAILGCAGVIAVLKLLLAACGHRLGVAGLLSPSGHSAMSAAVYGSLCLLIANPSPPLVRTMVYTVGALLIADIAASRVALRYHAPAEVAVGLIVGLVEVAVFRTILVKRPVTTLRVPWLVGAAAILVTLLYGTRWPAEQALGNLAAALQLLLPWCR